MIDGRDISGLLMGTATGSPREAHYYFRGDAIEAVRQGRWKLAIARQQEGLGRTGNSAPASPEAPRLYDLEQDVGETTDVAAAQPEVVDRLRRLTLAMQAELGDQAAPGRRPAGRVEHPTTLYPVTETPAAAEPVKKAARR